MVGSDDRILEVHPEVSFRALARRALPPKATWNGFMERRRSLAEGGIVLPETLREDAPLVDVLDAAAASWSAKRYARGEAERLGDDTAAIWY